MSRVAKRPKIAPLWGHPAIAGKHVVSMTRDYPAGVAFGVATCQCGWLFRVEVAPENAFASDRAVEAHWRDAIAESEGTAS